MILNQWSLFLLSTLLAFETYCDVKASKVSESQVASDLTLASSDSVTTSPPIHQIHLLHNSTSTNSSGTNHTIKSSTTILAESETSATKTPQNANLDADKITTESPKGKIVDRTEISTNTTLPSIKLTHDSANKGSKTSKFHAYLKPICEIVDKIHSKQLSQVQSQLKQFVHLSTGKLASCFLESYKFDPTSSPITGHNLKIICSSERSTTEHSKSFETCAEHNWSSLIDQELDKISAARANHTKNHQHSKEDTSATLEHDENEETSFVSGVVSKFFGPEKDITKSSSDYLDISITPKPKTTTAPLLSTTPSHSATPTSGAPSFMNDPNTFVVFVDSASTTASPNLKTALPLSHKPSLRNEGELPVNSTASSTSGASTTKSPIGSLGLALSTSQPTKSSTTIGPSSTSVRGHDTTSASASSLSSTKVHISSNSVKAPATKVSTSMKPLASLLITKKSDAINITKDATNRTSSTSKPSVISSTTKPVLKTLDTYEEILERQEKEKQELEQKLKSEREKFMKQLQKKQDEIDAQIAVKALQHQRDASSGHSDGRLHQIEHERQMTIDPIGHTLKHQQYELNKQQNIYAGK